MSKLSVLIPSRGEVYMPKTVNDLFEKAAGEIEVIVVLDGYWPDEKMKSQAAPDIWPLDRPNLTYIHYANSIGMRAAINAAARIAKGDFLMKLDAHCMMAPGFDEALKADCEDNWVAVPRRLRLDAENWALKPITDSEPPIDYERFIYPDKFNPRELHGYKWNERTAERKDILIDDLMTFQGSCWFMHRSHFDRCGFMAIDGYNGLPMQEAEEISLTTWLSGGRVITNKKTWYAHWFKGRNRGYYIEKKIGNACYAFSYQHWAIERKEGFIKLIEHFWPLPSWPDDWKERLYK